MFIFILILFQIKEENETSSCSPKNYKEHRYMKTQNSNENLLKNN